VSLKQQHLTVRGKYGPTTGSVVEKTVVENYMEMEATETHDNQRWQAHVWYCNGVSLVYLRASGGAGCKKHMA
jgi:hypothetical protein